MTTTQVTSRFTIIFFYGCMLLYSKQIFASYPTQDSPDEIVKHLLVASKIPQYQYQIINKRPHRLSRFTEGLVLDHDALYASSGLYGQSTLEKIDRVSGKTLQKHNLSPQFFGEGITIIGNKLYQLTFREQLGLIYNVDTLKPIGEFTYEGEGWGLTHLHDQLILSNGTEVLTIYSTQPLKALRTITVRAGDIPLAGLNELQAVNGKIVANIFPTSIIVILSPQFGQIEGWLDIQKLKPNCQPQTKCVANGIAYDKTEDVLLVTGKRWPYLYEIQLQNGLQH